MSSEAPCILVVDDDLFIRKSFKRLLKILGYSALTANDGRDGLDQLEKHRDEIALVILDLYMPIMSGNEALAHIRRTDPELPVLVTSGHSLRDVEIPFLEDGFTQYVQKPVAPEDLSRILARMLE